MGANLVWKREGRKRKRKRTNTRSFEPSYLPPPFFKKFFQEERGGCWYLGWRGNSPEPQISSFSLEVPNENWVTFAHGKNEKHKSKKPLPLITAVRRKKEV